MNNLEIIPDKYWIIDNTLHKGLEIKFGWLLWFKSYDNFPMFTPEKVLSLFNEIINNEIHRKELINILKQH